MTTDCYAMRSKYQLLRINSSRKRNGDTMAENDPEISHGITTPSEEASRARNPNKNPVGRPKKRRGISFGGGRKKKQKGEAISESLKQKYAREIFKKILEENDPLIVNRIHRMFNRKKRREEKFFRKPGESTKKKRINRHTKESALAFFLEHRYTKKRYSALVKDSIERNYKKRSENIYPSYEMLKEAKDDCSPKGTLSSEREVVTPLQQLANKTGERLSDSVALGWSKKALKKVKIVFSGGFDSSAGHTNSHQSCQNPENETSITPLQMISESDDESSDSVWYNPTPASYRYCRPLRIAFEKENAETITKEYNRVMSQIKRLKSHDYTMTNGKKITITFEFHLTMFDGKCVSNILDVTATQRCPMCLRTTREFGDPELSFLVRDGSQALDLGIALLHAEIKIFEHLLHLSYRKNVQIWSITQGFRDDFEARKEEVIEWLRALFGIRVDQVLQGHGTTNTGNLARRCFQEPQKFAQALQLDENLVQNLADILILFKTKNRVDYDKLEHFCWEVYWDHYNLYDWALMNVSIHKLLMHGCQVAKKLPLPICYFSEDSQEAWHKFYRRNMTAHARQCSKAFQILDVYNRAIYESDPLISNILLDERSKFLEKKAFPERLNKYIIKSDSDGSDATTSGDEDDDEANVNSSEETTSSDADSDDKVY